MKLIIGLGNPGKKFEKNRHNVGHMFIDFSIFNFPLGFARGEQFLMNFQKNNFQFLKTDCFMNESGKFAKSLAKNRSILKSLYIVHDDLDILLGKYKIQFGVGPKVHYGVQSVENELGTKDFWRIRIGVDNRNDSGQARMTGGKYVLEDFTDEELGVLKGVFDAIVKDDSFPR